MVSSITTQNRILASMDSSEEEQEVQEAVVGILIMPKMKRPVAKALIT